MKETRVMMGMPITVEIVDGVAVSDKEPFFESWGHVNAPKKGFSSGVARGVENVFFYFNSIDERFSTYKPESEISKINRGEIGEQDWSDDMSIIMMLSEETKQRSGGFFDIRKPDGSLDPSGIVKGWAIWNAVKLLEADGFEHFFVDAGGDIQTAGRNAEGKPWSVGIKNPFKQNEIVKTIYANSVDPQLKNVKTNPHGIGIATSGTYIRGEHIYNPRDGKPANEIVSLTVIGPNVYEADRFATAAFAMGATGIRFIETLPGFEGYMIDKNGIATMTSGFEKYTHEFYR